ncbi:DUF2460 domain-containing protein [Amaricoccus solimangrovi]|uniref:TIGR02217 family protein n=1 Tax=Amaricoccus solimangrovi TaxID=2589815 RepID=A0A501WT44_9RHOB|nr:DUF2460 domain-containing protein [Amaricoccus solimangrovi]TPE52589.1 TIGR02217 family protein [Amaricoccus solimangrovi]
MAFFDLSFPRDVAAGVSGGPERRVNIASLGSGYEERNARWKHSRRSWQAGLGIRTADDLAAVLALFEEMGGPLHSFRFRDWSDFKSCAPSATPAATDQLLGTGDGAAVAFPLRKRYGSLSPYWRDITKPVPGTVTVALDGAMTGAGWAVDNLTGVVTFATPPGPGVAVRAGFEFDVPARFAADALAIDMAFFAGDRGIGSIPEVPLIEVRE